MDGGRDAATAEGGATMTADASTTASAHAGTAPQATADAVATTQAAEGAAMTTQAGVDPGTTAQTAVAAGSAPQPGVDASTPMQTPPKPTESTESTSVDGGAAVTQPPFAGRVSYVFSGRMPAQYAGWVFQDLTAPGWRWRQTLRSVLMMLPFAIILAVLPGPPGTRGMLAGFLLVAAAAMGLILAGSFRNRRLVQNGFPPIVRPEEDEDEPVARPASAAPVAAPTAAEARAADASVADAKVAAAKADNEADAGVASSTGVPTAGGGYDPEDPEGINA
ncbi:DUF5313 family protein [Frankia sp. AgB1.9]|uniref:DUF5313 family protein n=1 Tax=unclassified Frankia TaxID=2632575 RepID=UPI0019314A38|nr:MULTISPECIES: DUF5313 family protein [unclassified Frankia]MBL7492842.1 DUF5313 family protein [Frankia sp. AgW1.1]MBL7549174.1 DUF5313 family protein [Frankia sp. AgB1.9]MBL7623650.1 DUF5313 family protein [Frankia sp. AgB1.8]